MFDIGFWELLIIAVVLLLVLGPERLPEVAKQAAFWVRKARTGMHRLRSEMKSEIDGTPFADLQKARAEVSNFKNDMKQFGRDIVDSASQTADQQTAGKVETPAASPKVKKRANKKKTIRKKVTKAPSKKASKKTTAKVSKKKVSKKKAKKVTKKKIGKSLTKKK